MVEGINVGKVTNWLVERMTSLRGPMVTFFLAAGWREGQKKKVVTAVRPSESFGGFWWVSDGFVSCRAYLRHQHSSFWWFLCGVWQFLTFFRLENGIGSDAIFQNGRKSDFVSFF